MKSKLLIGLLMLSGLGNLYAFYHWHQSQNQFFNHQTQLEVQNISSSQALDSAEELFFLRDLLGRWFQFQSSNYLASQAALLPWLSKDLAELRQSEIGRLAPKMRDQQIEQTSEILAITQHAEPLVFEALVQVALIEDGKSTLFIVQNKIQIQKIKRSLENVWGYQVLQFQSRVTTQKTALKHLSLAYGRLSLVTLPCVAQDVKVSDPEAVQVKVVSTRNSELHLNPSRILTERLTLTAQCEGSEFKFDVLTDSKTTRFVALEPRDGKPLAPKPQAKARDRNAIKQSLAKELGFEIEESGKEE
ncbi:MAG: hypothetical protein ACK5P7_09875 [Bdellovibrio sp.]|jgi:hypothetical protein